MIYDQVDEKVAEQMVPIMVCLTEIETSIGQKREALKTEDSKRREQGLRDEIKALIREQRNLWGEQGRIRTEAFKDLLVEEYGLPRTHPKFDKVYSLAYEHGHNSGFSEIENYFMELVELVRE